MPICTDPCKVVNNKSPKFPLGCYGHCEEVCLDLLAPDSAEYIFQYKIIGGKLKQKKFFNQGDNFCFNTDCLNECNETTLEIYDSTGALIEFQDGDCTYSGFSFSIEIVYNK